ncbi:amidohydrolase [Arthrobacter russicus]|jgi:predicted amidohydrolase YtcJ|uniref:Amidohydrolase YtcJ n=1 Tax=Arthrobacter russicus TaxID=172040 RepID=A0ABU1J9L2_9MICC|nr:amidohydrolase family protein [Arthrobacter russicus]MDN5668937.1 amidohydrolase family protein [Renibacterium salmoninarum]MDR6268840.1 putative amidohydrolase YtcJ [Arthrobacter russicus]
MTQGNPSMLIENARLLLPGGISRGSILLEAGKIAAIGDAAARAGADSVIDAENCLVSPAFQDAHLHPHGAGLEMLRCDLSGGGGFSDYSRTIGEYLANHPDVDWVLGGGWSMEHFDGGNPTAEALDRLVPDRPAFLLNRDHHGAWANSVALRLAGIDAGTPDPRDGRIERHLDGSPSGTLHEGAMDLFRQLAPAPGQADLDAGFELAQAQMFAWGVTRWQDAIVGDSAVCHDAYDSYLRMADDGRLKATVTGALWWDRERGLDQIEFLSQRRARAQRPTFRAGSVKLMLDGVAENFTASMLEPYLDACGCVSGNSGKVFIPTEELLPAALQLDALGFQMHFHALGDAAVRQGLDVLEQVRACNGPRDSRHHLAHLQVVHPDDIPRFAELGAVANMQPLWASHEEQMDVLTIPFLGERRASWQYPFGGLLRAGARLAGGSDWPVSTGNPLELIHTAVNRSSLDRGPEAQPLLAEQGLSLQDAWLAHTSGTAFVNHDDDRSGSLETGKDADLVVLDRDPFLGPLHRIGEASVRYTIARGEVVFSG